MPQTCLSIRIDKNHTHVFRTCLIYAKCFIFFDVLELSGRNLIFVTLGQAISTYDKVKYFLEDKKDEAHEAVQNYFAQLFDSLTPWLATLVTDTQNYK